MSEASRYAVGIDLGTTHSALALVDTRADHASSEGARPDVCVLSIPQLVAQGTFDAKTLLPSFMYFAHEGEGAMALPWDTSRSFAVGEHARTRAVDAPNRVIASAKSWLCHAGVDRRSAILPLLAPDDVEKISPVEASWRYLEHLAEAFDDHMATRDPGQTLAMQDVILCVPASFDAAARELTVEAALAAGIERLTLLEEPQAALYAWLGTRGDAWRKELRAGDVILVVDVGGGTTDLSLIGASDQGGELSLERIAVGDHLLLGGDNMDLLLAHLVQQKLEAEGKTVDAFQASQLAFACRAAKEALLADGDVDRVPIAIASRGAKLLGATLRAELTRDEISSVVANGFFPEVSASDRPVVRARAALTELGLPYAQDAAITRHLAAFLGRTSASRPTRVLFNGGVMKSGRLRERVMRSLGEWSGGASVHSLEGADLDLAVARGAAYFGLVRRGKGVRIRGGTARAYYVGVEGAAPAIPGVLPPLALVCVAPRGMEEGTSARLQKRELGVVVGEPVDFRFFCSSVRTEAAGGEIARVPVDVTELAPIRVSLPAEGRREGEVVPVTLEAHATEVGTLELVAVPVKPRADGEQWKIELNVRAE